MIERKFVSQKVMEFQIKEYIMSEMGNANISHTEIQRTPLGEKVTIYTSKPGLVVGRKGENIKKLTEDLKTKFKMENPQIEVGEIENPDLNAESIAQRIIFVLERYGSNRFKSIGYKALQQVMDAGAVGAEIIISGKIPSARARNWRFYAGHLKKSGDISENYVKKNISTAKLKSGIVGIKVRILTPDVKLPDTIEINKEIKIEEVEKKTKEKVKEKSKKSKEKKENGHNKEKRTEETG